MKKIIEFKNLKTGSDWMPEKIQYHDAVKQIRRLRADEKVNKHGIVYRISSAGRYKRNSYIS